MVGRKGNIQARRATCIYARGRHRVWSILATTDTNKTILWGVLNRQKKIGTLYCAKMIFSLPLSFANVTTFNKHHERDTTCQLN